MKRFVLPLRLRSLAGGDAARKVTWLELFFDLIFVAAVSQVAGPLHEQYSVAGLCDSRRCLRSSGGRGPATRSFPHALIPTTWCNAG